jgi:hypothetical protein
MRGLGLSLLLSACPPGIPATPPPTVDEAPTPAAVATPEPAPKETAQPVAESQLPERFAKLGRPCKEIARNDGVDAYCDARDIAVGLRTMVDMVHGVPPKGAKIIHDAPRDNSGPGTELSIAFDGRLLWIRAVTCGKCRRVMGWAFVGVLDELSDAQLADVQDRAQLPKAPLLRTPAAWEAAYPD